MFFSELFKIDFVEVLRFEDFLRGDDGQEIMNEGVGLSLSAGQNVCALNFVNTTPRWRKYYK